MNTRMRQSFLCLFVVLCCCCGWKSSEARTTSEGLAFLRSKLKESNVVEMTSGLLYKVLNHGPGNHHPRRDTAVKFHYTATTLTELTKEGGGAPFESTYDKDLPVILKPNDPAVVKGLSEALQMMVEGDKWELYLHSDIGYGDDGKPPNVGPGEVLIYSVEIIEVMGEDDAKMAKLRCNADTGEDCNEQELDYLKRLTLWNLHKKKFEIERLKDILDNHEHNPRFREPIIDWARRRIHILRQMVVYHQDREPNPYGRGFEF